MPRSVGRVNERYLNWSLYFPHLDMTSFLPDERFMILLSCPVYTNLEPDVVSIFDKTFIGMGQMAPR